MSKKRKTGREKASTPKPSGAWRAALLPLGIFAWSLLVQIVYLRGELLIDSPISPLFFGDGPHFLETARAWADGRVLASGLPFHPPVTIWLLVPLWSLLSEATTVYVASKLLMVLLNAATAVGIFLLLRERIPQAAFVSLLLPLGFGELLLGSVANSESAYRLLLVVLLLLGRRWPIVAGLVHGLAILTRAEHILLAGLLLLWGLARTNLRRQALLTLVAAVAVLLPWSLHTHGALHDYNQRFAEELVEPLPEWVPVSFYGPLNFALAHAEEDIFFSRQTLPVPRGEASSLDPTEPTHNAYVLHGYRIGLEVIAQNPVRFVRRTLRKLAFSMRALAPGWTWRDFPRSGLWIRRPVDLASAAAPVYTTIFLTLAVYGAWTRREDRLLLAVIFALVLYRLAINAMFFPYLRGMTIASPAVLVLAVVGIASLFRHLGRPVLIAGMLLVGGYHLASGWQVRNYGLTGERDPSGRIIDDRTVTLQFKGFRDRR